MSYWDSSALVKLYAKEADSSAFEQIAGTQISSPVISRFGIYEIATTLWRKEAEGLIAVGAALATYQKLTQDVTDGRILAVEFTAETERRFRDSVARCFQNKPAIYIRTLDAIHLGSGFFSGGN